MPAGLPVAGTRGPFGAITQRFDLPPGATEGRLVSEVAMTIFDPVFVRVWHARARAQRMLGTHGRRAPLCRALNAAPLARCAASVGAAARRERHGGD
jgi:hypothetical protein